MTTMPVPLPHRERDILWLASQGHTSEYIARLHGMDDGSVRNVYHRISKRFGTRNLVHSVAYGLLQGVIGQYRDCGERRAYLRHLRRSETPCQACRIANTLYVQAQTSGAPGADPSLTPTQVRIFKHLDEHDCSLVEAADCLSMDRRRIASHMSQAYQRLGCTHLARYDRRPYALKLARDKGYLE